MWGPLGLPEGLWWVSHWWGSPWGKSQGWKGEVPEPWLSAKARWTKPTEKYLPREAPGTQAVAHPKLSTPPLLFNWKINFPGAATAWPSTWTGINLSCSFIPGLGHMCQFGHSDQLWSPLKSCRKRPVSVVKKKNTLRKKAPALPSCWMLLCEDGSHLVTMKRSGEPQSSCPIDLNQTQTTSLKTCVLRWLKVCFALSQVFSYLQLKIT